MDNNIKQVEFKDEIGIFRNVYPKNYCNHIISEFNRLEMEGDGLVINRRIADDEPPHRKNDSVIHASFIGHEIDKFKDIDTDGIVHARDPIKVFFRGIQACMEEYIRTYSVLEGYKLKATAMKIQRTSPGGGYHIWHAERGSLDVAGRELVYMLYLNTIPSNNGGETEFLYKRLRISPEENTVLVWPAGFTHAHRGNMVLGEEAKYIITGWVLVD